MSMIYTYDDPSNELAALREQLDAARQRERDAVALLREWKRGNRSDNLRLRTDALLAKQGESSAG